MVEHQVKSIIFAISRLKHSISRFYGDLEYVSAGNRSRSQGESDFS